MGVGTNVLMDHTASTNEDHDYNNSLIRGSVVRRYWYPSQRVLLSYCRLNIQYYT
jgi:hypothetical protein